MEIRYNVTGDRRKALVKVISDTTGVRAVYKFMPTCNYEIDYFTVTKDGTLIFDDRADSEEVEKVLDAIAEAGFDCEPADTESDSPKEAEQDAPAAESEDAPQQAEQAATGADSAEDGDQGETISLTVSLPTAQHTGTTLRNLVNLIYTRASLLNKALGTAFRVDEGLTDALLDDSAILTAEAFRKAVAAYEGEHGKAIDGLTITPETIIFASLPETDDPAVIRTFTELCALMNKQALTQKRIQAKEVNEDNEKYSMRIWLIRLGLNGPDHKETRKVLMENLSGHCAFRTEAEKVRWQERQAAKREALKAAKASAATETTEDAGEEVEA